MGENHVILLGNYDVWNQYLEYKIFSKEMRFITHDNYPEIRGVYVVDADDIRLFYRSQGELTFVSKGVEISLEDSVVQLERNGATNTFRISQPSESILFEHTYPSLSEDPINKLDWDFNEDMEEDQDFYLFVYNVLKSPEKRNRIYTE